MFENVRIAVIGLGYVGLPLAMEFSKKVATVAFDINKKRIVELKNDIDSTLEVVKGDFEAAKKIFFTDKIEDLKSCNVYIITVPTPIDDNNTPNLEPLLNASALVAGVIAKGDTVVFESTVYPGATEEKCIPVIESGSGLKYNVGFFAGYSPERINPGDRVNTLTKIKKITSGSTRATAEFVDSLYDSIIDAGTHRASSIRVAEAAKVIENTQRDLNIAIINEFAKIFNKLGIDTQEVLEAAGTKWNFLPFSPGLVGGHCISVDPYYLTHKAKEVGYQPEVILAGRRINEGMAAYCATQIIKALSRKNIRVDNARVLILGFTFKGNCPDIRNTKIIDLVTEIESYNAKVDVFDSWANPSEVEKVHKIRVISDPGTGNYDAVIIAVDHSEFRLWGEERIRKLCKPDHVLYDIKHVLKLGESDMRL